MAERLKAVASKAIVRIADRGFESLSLRHSTHNFSERRNYLLVAGYISKSGGHEQRRAALSKEP